MGTDIHFFVEHRVPSGAVPDLTHATDPRLAARLREAAAHLDAGRPQDARRSLEAARALRCWRAAYDPDPSNPPRHLGERDWNLKHHNLYGYSKRNYLLFGLLAGVRAGNFQPPIPPRGLPEDASPTVRLQYQDDRDAHTPSWLTLAELQAFPWDDPLPSGLQAWDATFKEACPDFFRGPLKQLPRLGAPEDVRVVFWFDN